MPTTLMSPMLPMPFQSVKDSRIVPIAGPHTSPTTTSVGIGTMGATMSRSRPVSEPSWRGLRGGFLAGRVAVAVIGSAPEDRGLLVLDLLGEAVDVVRVADELLQGRDHHGGGEVRAGVAVEELRDGLGLAHQLLALLLQGVVAAGVRVVVGADVVRVGLEVGVL